MVLLETISRGVGQLRGRGRGEGQGGWGTGSRGGD